MTSGRKTRPERAPVAAASAIVLALALTSVCMPAFGFDLPALMTLLAARPGGQARFTEQRFVQGMAAPLESSGTLSFAAPNAFTRRTLQPREETMAVDGNRVTLSRGGRSRSFALDSAPEAAVAVEAIRATLTGDAATLQRDFDATVTGDAAHWTLALVPHDATAARTLASVRLAGRGDAVDTVETRLADGDRSVLTITPLPAGAASAPAP